MGYVNEFPHSRMWDSDLRKILEMYEEVKDLPEQWEKYKLEMADKILVIENKLTELGVKIDNIDDFIQEYLDNADLQVFVNETINNMVTEGTFVEIVKPYMGSANLPNSEMAGQFLVSTANNGVAWLTVVNGNEVKY